LIRHTDCNKFSIQVQSLISQQSQYSIKTKNNNLFLSLSLLSLPIFFTLTSSSFLFFFSFFFLLCLCLLLLQLFLFPLSISSLISESSYLDQKKVIHYYYIIKVDRKPPLAIGRVAVTVRSPFKFLVLGQSRTHVCQLSLLGVFYAPNVLCLFGLKTFEWLHSDWFILTPALFFLFRGACYFFSSGGLHLF